MDSFLKNGTKFQSDLLLLISILTYTVTLSLYTIAKHNGFSTYAWDLGIFNQGFWTTTFQDQIFQYTCEKHLVASGSFFGIHFSPILFLVVPVYYLFPYVTSLLVVQSLILGLSAVPVYKMAQTRFNPQQSVILAILYLLNPALHGINSYDFHVQAFLPLILNYLVYYTQIEDRYGTLLSANMAMAVQEQVFYLILAYIGYLSIRAFIHRKNQEDTRKNASIILGILISAIIWRALSSHVINFYNPEIPDHLKAGQHFAVLGVTDPALIPFHILLNPGSVLRALVFEWYDKLVYLLAHFTPYLFIISQGSLTLIPSIPWFMISLLSNYPPYYRIGFQYSAYIIPFIYNSFIIGLAEEYNSRKKSFKKMFQIVTCLIIASSLALSPLSPLTKGFYLSPSYQKPVLGIRSQRVHEIISLIPGDASILTQDNLFPHVSDRADAYVMVPSSFRDVKTWKEAITWITTRDTDYILMDVQTDPHGTAKYLFDIAKRGNYGLVCFYDNVYLYRKNYDQPPLQYERINITYSVTELLAQNMVQQPDGNSTYGIIYAYKNTTIPGRTLWYGPYEVMPRGNYTVMFHVKTFDNQTSENIRVDAYGNQTIYETMTFTEDSLLNNTWTDIGFYFTLPDVVYDLEFRGFLDGENTTIRLDSIRLTQNR